MKAKSNKLNGKGENTGRFFSVINPVHKSTGAKVKDDFAALPYVFALWRRPALTSVPE